MAILVASDTPTTDKNFWSTSPGCFADAEHLYGRKFQIDMAAEPQTTKVSRYLLSPGHKEVLGGALIEGLPHKLELEATIQAASLLGNECVGFDALTTPWEYDWWCNPPFDLKEDFIRSARRAQKEGISGMMLLPYEPLTQWWRGLLAKEVVVYEPDGRYNFLERDGKTKKQGVNFGSVFVVFPTFKIGESIRVPFMRGIHTKKRGGVRWVK